MKNYRVRLVLLLSLTLLANTPAAWAARQPTAARSAVIIQNYFHHYGHKFKDSAYASTPVTAVDVKNIEELHKHYVHANALLTLQGGLHESVRVALVKNFPRGWRVTAWERE